MDISISGEWEIDQCEITLINIIGRGSFGIVYKALWRGTTVAVKIVDATIHDINEFRMELVAYTKLHHPNIVQLLGACTLQKPYYIVLEYMSNGNLSSHIPNMSIDQKLEICKDIAKGLAYLHNRKPQCLIHRDLKPDNILITASGKAKLSDFGISSFQEDANDEYEMTGETGTYRYMAPEVIRHEAYNSSVDIFSFGMIMFRIFEDNTPFMHYTLKQVIHSYAVTNTRPIFHKTDQKIQKVIEECWDPIKEQRPNALSILKKLELRLISKKKCFFF